MEVQRGFRRYWSQNERRDCSVYYESSPKEIIQLLGKARYQDTDPSSFPLRRGNRNPFWETTWTIWQTIPYSRIQTSVTGGLKNYGYELKHPHDDNKAHCKVRGITLNYKNKLNVIFNVLRNFVTDNSNESVSVVNAHKISRDRDNGPIS